MLIHLDISMKYPNRISSKSHNFLYKTVLRINIDAPNIFVFLNKYTIRLKYDTTDSKIKGKSFFKLKEYFEMYLLFPNELFEQGISEKFYK